MQYRLQLPILNLLTKSDVLNDDERNRLVQWFSDPNALYGDLLDDDADPTGVVGMELFRTMENVGVFGDMRAVSAKEGEGMEEIYGASQLSFFGGEDPDDIQ